jgi:hypothetical protein
VKLVITYPCRKDCSHFAKAQPEPAKNSYAICNFFKSAIISDELREALAEK